MACNAQASVTGVDAVLTYASIACVRASIPVAAVRPFGIPNINKGSSTEMVGVTFLQGSTIYQFTNTGGRQCLLDSNPACVLCMY